MANNKKCAHPICTCPAREGDSYCSDACKTAGSTTEIECNCRHSGCGGKA